MATKKSASSSSKPSLTERLLKTSKIKMTAVMPESKLFEGLLSTPTRIPVLNVALSGDVEGGLEGGLGCIAGPSKHFKTGLTLEMVAAYLNTYEDAICLFYDSEFGAAFAYFESAGIDVNRVVHTPIMNIEELKFDIVAQLMAAEKGDHLIIFIDSIGNLASLKELEDVIKGESKADMTRAKQLKSLSRMITPYLSIKDIPCIAINHTYSSQDGSNKQIVSGGTGFYYSSDWIFVMGREQIKDKVTGEILGYQFNLRVEKSRYVRESSKFPIVADFDTGIDVWGGLLDLALELGYVDKPSVGWFSRPCVPGDKSWRRADTSVAEFWGPVFKETDFSEALAKRFKLMPGEKNSEPVDPIPEVEEEGETE